MRCSLCKKVCKKFYEPNVVKLNGKICSACKRGIKCFQKKMWRLAVLKAYGDGKCACCGEVAIEFLTLDHIDGFRCPGESKRGWGEYKFLIENNFPYKSQFRVLCMNCNWALGIKGYCPHKTFSTESLLHLLV